jgi:glycosyltransferase involved in cell wall biosynthesis
VAKVTVILTSFNHEKFIRESIESVLNQTFKDFELFIWDDASKDSSWEIIQSYKDSRIRAYRNPEQRRGIYGINKTISELAQAGYIAIHHSDDVWEPEKLSKQVAFLNENPDIGAVFTNALAIDEEGVPLSDKSHFYSKIFDQKNRDRFAWLNHFFYHGNALCHPSVLIRKECYEKCGIYRYGFAQIGDFDMWVRLCLQYEIYVFEEKLVRFRVLDNEANTSGSKPLTQVRINYELIQVVTNYLCFQNERDLFAVFPEAKKYNKGRNTATEFVLAMLCTERSAFAIYKIFGLSLLFRLLNDKEKSLIIEKLYSFTYIDYINLTSREDLFNSLAAGLSAITTLYIDDGSGIRSDFAVQKTVIASSYEGIYCVTFEIDEVISQFELQDKSIKLRWDPIEGIYCICRVISAYIDDVDVELVPTNSINSIGGFDVFHTNDPIYLLAGTYKNPKRFSIKYQLRPISITEVNGIVEEKDRQMAGMLEQIAQKDQQIVRLGEQLEERDSHISRILDHVEEKDRQLAVMLEQTAQKDQQIARLGEQLEERDSHISCILDQVEEKDRQLTVILEQSAQKVQQLRNLSERLDEQQAELSAIYQTKSWRWTSWMRCLSSSFKK